MKTRILLMLLFITNTSFSQTVNDYKAVVIPLKYEFQKSDNQYRLQTLTKVNLQKAGFQAFYNNEIALAGYPDRCSLLYLGVNKENAFLTTKLSIFFKDCFGSVVYQSAIGKSKEKDFEASYVEAINEAFKSVYALNYKFNENSKFAPKAAIPADASVIVPVVVASTMDVETKPTQNNNANILYAQVISYGYQLIDSEPKVIMKIFKTSSPVIYIAKKGDFQGVFVSKDNQWFFEYYQNDKLVSEKIDVKF